MVQDRIWTLIAKNVSGEISEEEQHELEQLFRENTELHYPVQIISEAWFSDVKVDKNDAHEAFDRHVQRMNALNVDYDKEEGETADFTPVSSRRKFIKPAFGILLLFGLIVFGIRFLGSGPVIATKKDAIQKPLLAEVSGGKKGKTLFTLPDGTKVFLNAGSHLTYDSSFNKEIREVSLTGEGFFDVVKNKLKPFVIHTSVINIKVLGTAFNVKSYAAEKTTEAALIRGSIEVTFKDDPKRIVILKPNEKIIVDNIQKTGTVSGEALSDSNSKTNYKPNVAIQKLTHEIVTGTIIETSWIDNNLIFQDESFEKIAGQLERFYGVSIVFKNNNLKENHLTGNFRNETIRQALDALKLTAGFNYEIDNNNLVTIF